MAGEFPGLSEDLLVEKKKGKTSEPLCVSLHWDMIEPTISQTILISTTWQSALEFQGLWLLLIAAEVGRTLSNVSLSSLSEAEMMTLTKTTYLEVNWAHI